VQEKARNDAELDDSWADYEGYGGEHSRQVSENFSNSQYNLLIAVEKLQGDRGSSPENDFVDIEGDRPSTSKAAPIIPAMPEVKRSRGRPRKLNTTVEDGKHLSEIIRMPHFVSLWQKIFFKILAVFFFKLLNPLKLLTMEIGYKSSRLIVIPHFSF